MLMTFLTCLNYSLRYSSVNCFFWCRKWRGWQSRLDFPSGLIEYSSNYSGSDSNYTLGRSTSHIFFCCILVPRSSLFFFITKRFRSCRGWCTCEEWVSRDWERLHWCVYCFVLLYIVVCCCVLLCVVMLSPLSHVSVHALFNWFLN